MFSPKFSFLLAACGTFLFLQSCHSDDEEPRRDLNGKASGAFVSSSVAQIDNNRLTCQIMLYIVDDDGNFVNDLRVSAFELNSDDTNAEFTITGVSQSRLDHKGKYASALLMDQSGSMSSNDPNDLRIGAAEIFMNSLGSTDQVMLASFTSNYRADLWIHGDGKLTHDVADLIQEVNDLAGQEGGGTPLYRSCYAMSGHLADAADDIGYTNRALIAFTDGQNTDYADIDDVVDYANSQHVMIYTVGLSDGTDPKVLSYLAGQTGGAYMQAEDAEQLITMFGTLGDLLSGTAKLYSVAWEARTTSSWQKGNTFTAYIDIDIGGNVYVRVPFSIVI
ncbi:von Willebrand factor type A domain-containing protein [Catalinimonas alkaloidigena]|uniref:von Willebrand factor type A domain-containing protein n=1 Tax=Catalinimonas alkaloidigena TaxID=1075417 RepID=A0A1G9EMZ9_9BACT|nr:vWA domain-containing protein [Catalinimonas alkaloidigena]SDK77577.1 von Willebrand factor type A domain-containing protein [Catalinimonas alkaloidigena]